MADALVSPDIVQFAVGVTKATYQGKLEWETTADENAFVAPLGGAYTASIERGWGTDQNEESYRTYELVLAKSGDELFRLSPGELYETDFTRQIGKGSTAHQIFEQVWSRANWKAKRVTDELSVVNRLLGSKLQGNTVEVEDDEDVPF